VHVPGRGEFFLRDSGGDGPALLLLHGWMVSADLNWITVYDALAGAGYRVLALDHRGHGRGLRSPKRFRLTACADDAAALVRHEGIERVVAVGYSDVGRRRALARQRAHIAEAGRELGRYDGRPWLAGPGPPRAVIVTAEDNLVPPRKQRELAALLGVAPREVPGTHVAIMTHTEPFVAALLDALAEVGPTVTLAPG
jgi:pimeloyl-ACP methyl ester carboxylesterase